MGNFERFWGEILFSIDRTSPLHNSFTVQLSDEAIKRILEQVNFRLGYDWEKNYLEEFDIRNTGNRKQKNVLIDQGQKTDPVLFRIFLCNIGLLAKHGCKERLYYQFWYDAIQNPSEKYNCFDDLCSTLKTRQQMYFSNSFFNFVKYFALSISKDNIARVLMQDRFDIMCDQMRSTELQNILYYRMWDLFTEHEKVVSDEQDPQLQKYKANYHFVSRVFNNDEDGLNNVLINHRDLLSMQDINKCFIDYLNNYYQSMILSLRKKLEFHGNDKTDCFIRALRHNFWITMSENCSQEIIKKVINYYYDQTKFSKSQEGNNAIKDTFQNADKSGENLIHKLIKYKKNEVVKYMLDIGLFDVSDATSYISYAALYKNYKIIPFIHAKQSDSKVNVNAARIISERSQAEAWAQIL